LKPPRTSRQGVSADVLSQSGESSKAFPLQGDSRSGPVHQKSPRAPPRGSTRRRLPLPGLGLGFITGDGRVDPFGPPASVPRVARSTPISAIGWRRPYRSFWWSRSSSRLSFTLIAACEGYRGRIRRPYCRRSWRSSTSATRMLSICSSAGGKLRHALMQALTDQRAGEHQLGRRRLVWTIRTVRRRRARPARAGPCDLQSRLT